MDAVERQFVQKAAGFADLCAACAFALFGIGEDEGFFGAGHADVEKAAFFGDAVFVDGAVLVRQQVFFHAGNVGVGEFQPFGGVQGHELHGVLRFVIAVEDVQQGEVLEDGGEALQAFVVFFEFFEPGDELGEAFFAFGGAFVVFMQLFQVVAVFDVVEDVGEQGAWRHVFGVALHPREPVGEQGEVVAGAVAEWFLQGDVAGGECQRFVLGGGVSAEFGDGLCTEFAFGDVADAQEGGVVFGVVDEAQIGEQVADFGVIEEALSAAQGVGDGEFAQLLFEDACLEVAAVEDGEVAVGGVCGDFAGEDVAGDEFGFRFFVAQAVDVDAFAVVDGAPQAFFDDVRVVGNQGVGGGEDALVAAVVLFEFDGFEARVVFVQVQDVLRARAAKGVDGLVVVADDGEGFARAGQ